MAGVKGRSGRKRKCTQTLKLHGTFRADRHNVNAPEPDVSAPLPPKWLAGEALAEWHRIVPLLLSEKCVSQWDRTALVLYCQEWATYVDVTEQLRAEESMLAEGASGQFVEHPLLRIQGKCFKRLLQVCSEFGLTPAARSRLNVSPTDATDPLEQWLRQQQQRRQSGGKGA